MTAQPFDGVFPAMVTPFTETGRIDHDRLRSEVHRLEAAGVDGLVPVGTTGESATLTHDEHIEVIETVVEHADVPVIAGAGSNATHEALALSQEAADAGADALLLIAPYYNRPEQAGLRDHFLRIADEVDCPQLVYDVPSRTGQPIAVDTAVELASHPNVRGFKAASGDLGAIGELIERTEDERFAVLSGDDALTLPALSIGAAGAISVAANVEPELTTAMVHAALAGDYEHAREHHRTLGPLFRALFAETNPIPLVEALAIRGHVAGRLRPPLTRLSVDERPELERVLSELANEPTPDPAAVGR